MTRWVLNACIVVALVWAMWTPVFGQLTVLRSTGSGGGGGTTLTDSASLATALSDETGTGAAVFGTSPTFTGTTVLTMPVYNTTTLLSGLRFESSDRSTYAPFRVTNGYSEPAVQLQTAASLFTDSAAIDYTNFTFALGHDSGWALANSRGAFFDSFESRYQLNNLTGAANTVSERHINFNSAAGTNYRMWSAYGYWDGHGGAVAQRASRVSYTDWADAPIVDFRLDDNIIDVLLSTKVEFAVNNVTLLTQRNAAGNAQLNLPYFGSDDRLFAGSSASIVGATPTTGTYANTFLAVQPTSLATNGIGIQVVLPNVTGTHTGLYINGAATTGQTSTWYNSSATATAHVTHTLLVGSGGGDPVTTYSINGVWHYTVGIDNSDSDKFKIAKWNSLGGGNDVFTMESNGNIALTPGAATDASGTVVGVGNAKSFAPTATSTMVAVAQRITPTINYSNGTPGAGSYEALKIAVTETALPTGTNYLIRASAGAAGSTDKFSVDNIGNVITTGNLTQIGYYQSTEMSAPSAPAANSGRLWFEDDGAGKTRLMVRFGTGVAQQIAIEP